MDGMLEHDGHVGSLLKALDDLGIANNTIVIYGTDNGVHMNSWPDGGMTPFRSEKEHQLGRRLSCAGDDPLARPHQARTGQQRDLRGARLVPDAAGAAGEPDIKNKLLPAISPAARRSRCTSTATTSCRC
jgi:arylsulfatase